MKNAACPRLAKPFGLAAIAALVAIGCGGETSQEQADSQLSTDQTKSVRATVITDVRKMMTAQEKYFGKKKSYAPDNATLNTVVKYKLSKGNVLELTGTDSTYTATVTNTRTDQKCSVKLGPGVGNDGRIMCL